MSFHRTQITLPIDGEDVEALVSYYFYNGYLATRDTPFEPPEVDITAVTVNGKDVYKDMSVACYRYLYGEILERMLGS